MKTFIYLIATLMFLSICSESQARKVFSNTDGSWPSTGTWRSGHVPASGDTITISSSDTVTVTSVITISGSAVVIEIDGTLVFDGGGAKLNLPTGSYVNVDSTGTIRSICRCGGMSQVIKSGTATIWDMSMSPTSGPSILSPTPLPIQVLAFDVTPSGDDHDMINYHLMVSGQLSEGMLVERIAEDGSKTLLHEFNFAPGEVKGSLPVPSVSNVKYYYQITDRSGQTLAFALLKADIRHASGLTVYPNPAVGHDITLSATAPIEWVKLMSSDGRLVQTQFNVTRLTWNENLRPGIYYLQAQTAAEIIVKPIIIQ